MSELKAVLTDVLRGRGDASSILHNCRFDGAGASAYGREAILELFRNSAQAPDYVQAVQGPRCLALFALNTIGSMALFADTYDERVTRIWHLAPRPFPCQRTQRIDVPFDPTFGALTPRTVFDPTDQPDLSAAHLPRVQAWGAEPFGPCTAAGAALKALTKLSQLRLYVLRAFSAGDVAAVLAIVIAQRNGGTPGLVQFPIAARLPSEQPGDATVVIDEGELEAELARIWRPVL
jgi:hypothetical protein